MNNKDVLGNYRAGAIWRTRQNVLAYSEDDLYSSKKYKVAQLKSIPKNKLVFVIKIVEDFGETHLKVLYNKQVYYIPDIKDVCLFFFYEEEKVINNEYKEYRY